MARSLALLMLAALMALIAQGVHADAGGGSNAPIEFWNVTNWWQANGQYAYVRDPDYTTAFTKYWTREVPTCGVNGNNNREWVFVDASVQAGSYYPWVAAARYDTRGCDGSSPDGPHPFTSDARHYVNCPGERLDQWYYSARSLWLARYGADANGDPLHTGCDQPPKNKGSCPSCSGKRDPGSDGHNGDPVNSATGNKYEIKTEYRGTGPFPLDFTWTYNSTGGDEIGRNEQMILGAYRTHSYQRSVRVFPDASDPDPSLTTAYVSRPDGNSYAFAQSGDNWISPSTLDGTLTASYDGSHNITAWSYRNPQNEVESFDANGNLLSLTDPNGYVQTMSYDSLDRLATVTDMSGRQLVFSYNSDDRLAQLALPDGGTIQFVYNASDGVRTVTYPDGKFFTYYYGETPYASGKNHLLTGEIDETGTRYSTTSYDSYSRAASTFLGTGIDQYTFNYFNSSTITHTTVTLPLGETRNYSSFQTILGLTVPNDFTRSCSGCTPHTQTYSYSTDGHVASVTDFQGTVTNLTQDPSSGLETRRVEAASTTSQRTLETDWNNTFRKPTERRTKNASGALVAKTNWTYNSRGQVLTRTQTDPANSATRTTTTTYCEQTDITAGTCPLLGLVTSVDGPRTNVSDVTTYTYYQTDDSTCAAAPTTCPHRKGDLWKVTNALGQVTTYLTYDGAGRPLSMTDANGVETDMAYNLRGWLTTRTVRGATSADDHVTGYSYYDTGLVQRVTQPDASYTNFTYDDAHRLTDIADNIGDTIHYTLDAAGNRTKEDTKDPSIVLKRSVQRIYNQLGQLATTANADATPNANYTYDANGNSDLVTDGRGYVTDSDYDPLNRLSQVLQDTAHVNARTIYTYDALDHLVNVQDPYHLSTAYQYDGLDNLTQLASPDTGTTNYTVDSAGNRLTQTDARGVTATYSYDALNRLTGIAYPTTSLNLGYGYDTVETGCPSTATFAKGRLTHYTDTSGSTLFCYDRFGNMVQKTQSNTTTTFTISYAYDKGGRITQIGEPLGTVVDYTRDTIGRITAVGYHIGGSGPDTPVVSNVTYYPFGPVASITYGTGTGSRTLTRAYDQDYVVSGVTDPKSPGLQMSFGRDVLGNITQATIGSGVNNYAYDGLNRLTGVTNSSGTPVWTYTYDATGNRLSKQSGTATAVPYAYPSTSHQLAAVGTVGAIARTYDSAGNTKTIGSIQTFVYDDTGRMNQLKNGSTQVKKYMYDARGERVRKSHDGFPGEVVRTVYDEAGHVLGDFDSSNNIVDQYIWLDDLPVGVLSGTTSTLAYIEPDHLGTPRKIIDPTRNATIWSWSLLSDPFGETAPNQDPDGDGTQFVFNMRLPGQYFDAESGLSYNYFRDYDSTTGRYVESDPLGLGDGPSTYSYVRGRPLFTDDPNGLKGLYGFPHDKQILMENALADAIRTLKICKCSCFNAQQHYCFDEFDKYAVIGLLESLDFYWEPKQKSDSAAENTNTGVIIYPLAFAPGGCPLASTLAHEANHNNIQGHGGPREPGSYYIEDTCFHCRHYEDMNR